MSALRSFETVLDPDDVNRVRATFGEKMQVIGPKLEASGIFVGKLWTPASPSAA
jgi:hypothetical protein